ncbi:hypothetical protein [Streptosporangium lutulentum]|uniref:Immunity protein 35 domain-containing protein n=1 Tax=Streptosporangium lutulentum TaxID=1461250 RepID=A0ABT9QUL6_9ACTN|nr:hypothetical protein [Streptosporangium lutulentum]MDP9850452.1 hypothetical protein [Streptosporangium lutulentum]
MIPSPGTPEGDWLNAPAWWHPAITVLQGLQAELRKHRIYSEISCAEGQLHLAIGAKLIVQADRAGRVFCWGAEYPEETADRVSVDDPQVAYRIAEWLDMNYPEPVMAP